MSTTKCAEHRAISHDFYLSCRPDTDGPIAERLALSLDHKPHPVNSNAYRSCRAYCHSVCSTEQDGADQAKEAMRRSQIIAVLLSEATVDSILESDHEEAICSEWKAALEVSAKNQAILVVVLLGKHDAEGHLTPFNTKTATSNVEALPVLGDLLNVKNYVINADPLKITSVADELVKILKKMTTGLILPPIHPEIKERFTLPLIGSSERSRGNTSNGFDGDHLPPTRLRLYGIEFERDEGRDIYSRRLAMERCGDLEQHRFEFHLRMENPFASRRDLINYRLITPESWPIPNEPRSIHDGQKWTVNGWVPKKHQPKLKHQPADLKMPPVFERLVEDGNNKIKEKEEARPSSGPANESTADEEFRFKRKKPPPHMGELISTLSEPKKYPPPLTHRHHELEEHLGLLEKLRQKTARPFDRQVVERLAQPKVWVQPEWIPPKPPKFKRIKRRPVPSIGATQSEPEPSSEGQEEQVDGDTAEENALKVENLDDSVAGGNEEGSGEPQDDGRVAKPAEENASAYDEAQSETRDPVQSDVDAQEANSSSDNKEVPAENGELSVNVSHDEDEKKAEGEVEHADKRAEEPDQMTIVADSSTGNNNTTVTPQADEKSTESDLEQHASDPAKVSDPQEGDGSPAAISNQVPRSVDGQEAAPPTQVDAAPLQAPMPEDQRTEEQPAPETNTQDQPAPNQPALQEPATDPETKSEDQAAQEQSVQETTNQDQLTAEQLSQEQAVQETVTQDQPTAEQPAPDSGATADAPIDVPVATENNEVVVQPVAETKRQVANQPQTENEAPETNTSDTNANHPSQEKEATVGVESESGVKATEGLDQTTGEATAESSAENATVTVTSEDQTVTAAETTEAKEVEEAEVAAPNNQEEKGETETAM